LALRALPGVDGFVFGLIIGITGSVALFVSLAGYSILVCVALYRSYRSSGVEMKRQLRWPLWGTLTALGGWVLVMVVASAVELIFPTVGPAHFVFMQTVNNISKLLYLLIPISFALAIVKYRLMDIDVIIRKTVVYSGVTGFIIGVYLLLAGVSGLALVRSIGLESQIATVIATLAVVALFVPVRSRIQAFVDRRFFRRERSYEEVRRRIVDSVARAVSLDRLLPEFAEDLQQAVQCRSVAVLVRRPGSDRYRVESAVGLSDRAADRIALDRHSPLLATDASVVELDGVDLPEPERTTLRRADASVLVIARRADETVGIITLGRKLDRERYDTEDSVFLASVAGQLSLAVGRLHQRLAESELSQAREIQESLLPAHIPQIPGVQVTARWQPAREVSGDYYDVLRLGDSRLALCIGDVVGKGMPAALLMSSLQAAVKAVAPIEDQPARVCAQVGSVVRGSLSGGKFVTFFYGVLDTNSGIIRYANAGHNPPILIRGDDTLVRLEVGGPAIARLLAELPYQGAELPIRSGDRIVLYTDGVTEAMSPAGELFGERRLEELVRRQRASSADELETALRQAVLDFADGELQDDLTLVVAAIS
jgi:sigma-B regulation protein RsbU (phosphoserine phosphatase)